jgi:hypothetical protein
VVVGEGTPLQLTVIVEPFDVTVVLTVSAGPVGRPVTDPPLAPPAPVTPLLFASPV